MVHVVLVYQREEGRLLLRESYDGSRTAMEIVVLSAEHETHGRYFYTAAELLQRLRNALDAA
jgi:hypothetical protein